MRTPAQVAKGMIHAGRVSLALGSAMEAGEAQNAGAVAERLEDVIGELAAFIRADPEGAADFLESCAAGLVKAADKALGRKVAK